MSSRLARHARATWSSSLPTMQPRSPVTIPRSIAEPRNCVTPRAKRISSSSKATMARSLAERAAQGSTMTEMRLIVTGVAGRMGRMVVRTIHEAEGLRLTGALEREDSPWLGQDPALLAGCPAKGLQILADPLPLLLNADAIIDFSSPAASVGLAG